jgi:uncharacterized repeat protein (TIGR03803 family)
MLRYTFMTLAATSGLLPIHAYAKPSETVLFYFNASNGANPTGSLLRDAAGNFYGGGNAVFKLTPPAAGTTAWGETILGATAAVSATLTANITGGSLVFDRSGNLYGAAVSGAPICFTGVEICGSIFKLSPPAAGKTAWTATNLIAFDGTNGQNPNLGLILDRTGNLYGTMAYGGAGTETPCLASNRASHCGAVFMLTPPAAGQTAWNETFLYSFTGNEDGAFPNAGVIADQKGNLYGTTSSGGNISAAACIAAPGFPQFFSPGCGVIYELQPPSASHGSWRDIILYSFTGGADGAAPQGELLRANDGSLYGAANTGGAAGDGTIFKLSPPAAGHKAWKMTVLYTFNVRNGALPNGRLVADAAGNLYGTTSRGGGAGVGTVFKLSPPAAGKTAWTASILLSLAGLQGTNPMGGVIVDTSGTLYGTANSGGQTASCVYGCGLVFKVTP